MGKVETLYGKVVGLDATLLLYYMQKNAKYISVLRSFFHAVNNREILAVTSSIVLLEINFNPIKLGHSELAKAYKDILLNSPGFTVVELTTEIAEEVARLEAVHDLHPADAIQMATAIKMNASYFLTDEWFLSSLPELNVLKLDELKTLPGYLESDDLH